MVLSHVTVVAEFSDIRRVKLNAFMAYRRLGAFRVCLAVVFKREGRGRRGRYGSGRRVWGVFTCVTIPVKHLHVSLAICHHSLELSLVGGEHSSSGMIITELTVSVGREVKKVKRRIALRVFRRRGYTRRRVKGAIKGRCARSCSGVGG